MKQKYLYVLIQQVQSVKVGVGRVTGVSLLSVIGVYKNNSFGDNFTIYLNVLFHKCLTCAWLSACVSVLFRWDPYDELNVSNIITTDKNEGQTYENETQLVINLGYPLILSINEY